MLSLFVYIAFSFIFSLWSCSLADTKGKSNIIGWGICGFFFNVIPVIALSALPSKAELMELMNKQEPLTSPLSESDHND